MGSSKPSEAHRSGCSEELPSWAREVQRPRRRAKARDGLSFSFTHYKRKQPLFRADATAELGLKIDLRSFCSSTADPAQMRARGRAG